MTTRAASHRQQAPQSHEALIAKFARFGDARSIDRFTAALRAVLLRSQQQTMVKEKGPMLAHEAFLERLFGDVTLEVPTHAHASVARVLEVNGRAVRRIRIICAFTLEDFLDQRIFGPLG